MAIAMFYFDVSDRLARIVGIDVIFYLLINAPKIVKDTGQLREQHMFIIN